MQYPGVGTGPIVNTYVATSGSGTGFYVCINIEFPVRVAHLWYNIYVYVWLYVDWQDWHRNLALVLVLFSHNSIVEYFSKVSTFSLQ